MKLLLLDFETTGLDLTKDRAIEFCANVWDTGTRVTRESSGYLWEPSYPAISESARATHGLDEAFLKANGQKPKEVFQDLERALGQVDFVVGHNVTSFDWPLALAEFTRQGIAAPAVKLIDTRYDLPYPEKMKCRKLGHLALDHGFIVDPAKLHGAKGDVEFMKMILEKYDLEEVARVSQCPWAVVRAVVSYDNREQAKARGYSWEKLGEKVYPKQWVKRVRDFEVAKELLEAPFVIQRLEG
jgi:DNA polymerase-3 subunit epsilon